MRNFRSIEFSSTRRGRIQEGGQTGRTAALQQPNLVASRDICMVFVGGRARGGSGNGNVGFFGGLFFDDGSPRATVILTLSGSGVLLVPPGAAEPAGSHPARMQWYATDARAWPSSPLSYAIPRGSQGGRNAAMSQSYPAAWTPQAGNQLRAGVARLVQTSVARPVQHWQWRHLTDTEPSDPALLRAGRPRRTRRRGQEQHQVGRD